MCRPFDVAAVLTPAASLCLAQIKHCDPPLSLHGQLLWREFFYVAATNNPNFDKMAGNPICVQIPWDKNPKALAKWASVSGLHVSVAPYCAVVSE